MSEPGPSQGLAEQRTIVDLCDILARTDATRMDPEAEQVAYKFIGALFRDRVFSTIDWFEFEDKFACWTCNTSGWIVQGIAKCPDCGGRGWQRTTIELGMRLRYQLESGCYETLIRSGLMRNFSQNDRFWDETQIPRKGEWRELNFRFVPMRTVPARPIANLVEPTTTVNELRRFLKERQRRIRQEAAAAKKVQ